LLQSLPSPADLFTVLEELSPDYLIPERFTYPFDYEPNALSLLAVEKLQNHLKTQEKWNHNFGLSDEEGPVSGKMFGVLVVENEQGEVGYLSAFSGKLAGCNHHQGFVPPVFDTLTEGGFLNVGMQELGRMNDEIRMLEAKYETGDSALVLLRQERKCHSVALQNEIFNQYQFLNQAGEERSLTEIFADALYKNPPAGAGECAAPKLLQYAFGHNLKPLAMAEFWWGLSPKSDHWKHGHFYPACREKCAPILGHMLGGMPLDEKPDPLQPAKQLPA
jgi:tRNA pseudouridine32 synthase/23S rRNA pseudouridine746 synthase